MLLHNIVCFLEAKKKFLGKITPMTVKWIPTILLLTGSCCQLLAQVFTNKDEIGKCYMQCYVPAQYETSSEIILVREASSRLEIVPPVYEHSSDSILIEAAYTTYELIPPQYTTENKTVEIKAATHTIHLIDPVYTTVEEQVLLEPAHTRWEKRYLPNNCWNAAKYDCTYWCLQEYPAVYKTVAKQIVKTPYKIEKKPVPAAYKNIPQAVLKKPATVQAVTIPAVYKVVKKSRMTHPPTERRVYVAALYDTICRKTLIREAFFSDWVVVSCRDGHSDPLASIIDIEGGTPKSVQALPPYTIKHIQQALYKKGYYTAAINNVFNKKTQQALHKFQQENYLPVGTITLNTLIYLEIIDPISHNFKDGYVPLSNN